eukprot:SAG22_NODE_5635_length_979_cov_1.142045_1_plen_43_part_01
MARPSGRPGAGGFLLLSGAGQQLQCAAAAVSGPGGPGGCYGEA